MQRDQAHKTNELLERIAKALEKSNVTKALELSDEHDLRNKLFTAEGILDSVKTITDDYASKHDIPGFENTLKELHDLKLHTDEGEQEDDHVHNDYLEEIIKDMNHIQYLNFHHDMAFGFPSSDTAALSQHIYELEYEEVLGAIKQALFISGDEDYVKNYSGDEKRATNYVKDVLEHRSQDYDVDNCDDDCNCKKDATPTSENPDPAGFGNKDPYTYDNNLREYVNGIVNDSDFNIRKTAAYYEREELDTGTTKKDCILDYVTNEFGTLGARYTDIIKFAYYLGAHNAPKYTSEDRGYYACAFATRYGGHLIQGGTNQLVKGINNEGKERYFTLSEVDNFTGFWKYIK